MATITTTAGAVQPDSILYSVNRDDVTTSTATTYAWNTWTNSLSGIVEHSVTLIGNFTYDGSGTPSGTIAQIRLDADADGSDDMTIAFPSFVAGLLPDLIGGSESAFFGAAFFQNDNITLEGQATFGRLLALGGDAVESNDTILITGNGGQYAGDAENASGGKLGGNDDFTINATITGADFDIFGDFAFAVGAFGGDDTITDITTAGTGDFDGAGDFQSASGGSTGGDDLIQGTNRDMVFSGDALSLPSGVTLNGGNDTLIGSIEDDQLFGDFAFTGASGNSTLDGGNDSILGQGGNDLIYGDGAVNPGGSVTVIGSNDTLRGGDGDDTLFGGGGIDFLFGDDGNDILWGGAGQDTFVGGADIDTIVFSDSFFALTIDLLNGASIGLATSGGVAEQVTGIENVIGTDVNDSIAGNDDVNVLEGGTGNDTLDGEGGVDSASYISATSAVTVDLALATQAIGGGQGTDTFISIEGVVGSNFDDTIFGGSGNDSIQGGFGDDTLLLRSGTAGFPAPGTDTIEGDSGNDVIGFSLAGVGVSNLGIGHVMNGGSEDFDTVGDTFVYETYSQGYEVILPSDSGTTGSFTQISTGTLIATLINFESIIAGNGDDVIVNNDFGGAFVDGNAGNDSITAISSADKEILGGDGNDTIQTGNGDDTISGGDDDDSINGGGNDDLINGDGGNDTLFGQDSTDTLFGGADNDLIILNEDSRFDVRDTADGGSGTDTAMFQHWQGSYEVSSAAGVVTVRGDSSFAFASTLTDFEFFQIGDDLTFTEAELLAANFVFGTLSGSLVIGTSGQDYIFANQEIGGFSSFTSVLLQGLGGDDFLLGSNGNDTLEGGAGADTLKGDAGNDTADYATSDARVSISLIDGTADFGHATGDELDAIENLIGSGFNDLLVGDNVANTLNGAGGNDNMNGRGGNDMLLGGAGADSLSGGNDNDTVEGGLDADVLRGNGGDDSIIGDAGADVIFGGVGGDNVSAGGDNDSVLGQGNNDTILGDAGNDTLRGGSGNDSIEGGNNNDSLFGNGNNDTLRGGEGNDSIQGNAGADQLFGDAGNDTLSSGNGGDRLDGGTGDDVMNGGGADGARDFYVFGVDYDTDRINAFDQLGTDRIELDQDLWFSTNPTLSAQEVVDTFGTLNVPGNILTLDFGGGDVLEVQNAGGIDQATFGADVAFI